MNKLFFNLGRSVGYATIPAIRKSKAAWQSLVGNEDDSIRAQAEFGKSLATELRLKVRRSNDPEARDLAQSTLATLVPRLRNKSRTFRVEILEDPAPSAVSLPGGYIFLNIGLIDFCRRGADELAFVVGHEMGHIVRGHCMERVLARIGVEGLSSIVSRGLMNPTLREAGLKWLQSSYARDAEMEADEFAVRLARAAGYNSAAALEFFDRISALRKTTNDPGEYFRSHPPENERAAQIRELIRGLPA